MSTNVTITVSLGSGAEGEALAAKIKTWAAPMPVSQAIRNLIKSQFESETKVRHK